MPYVDADDIFELTRQGFEFYEKQFKTPYILVLGDREAAEQTVSINVRGSNKQIQNVPLSVFLDMCDTLNEERPLELFNEVPEEYSSEQA